MGTGGLGAGYARSRSDTSGSHQTAFSQSIAPPIVPSPPGPKLSEKTKSNLVGTVQILAVGYGLFLLFQMNVLLGIIGLALVVIFWGKGKGKLSSLHKEEYKAYEEKYAKETEEYEAAVAEHAKWERTRICQRCGTRFSSDER